MVCLPYISCNGTCFVHEIFRLVAIERYIVTIYHIVTKLKWFPKVNFQSLYRGFGFVLPHYWVYLSPEGIVFESRRICFVSRRRCFESRRICFAPFLGLFASRRSCFAPRRAMKNAISTVLVLCTKHDDAIEHLSPSKPHKALQNRKIPL